MAVSTSLELKRKMSLHVRVIVLEFSRSSVTGTPQILFTTIDEFLLTLTPTPRLQNDRRLLNLNTISHLSKSFLARVFVNYST